MYFADGLVVCDLSFLGVIEGFFFVDFDTIGRTAALSNCVVAASVCLVLLFGMVT